MKQPKPLVSEASSNAVSRIEKKEGSDSRLFRKKNSTSNLWVDTSKSYSKSGEISSSNTKTNETYDGPSAKEVLSRMIVYNALKTDSSISTDSSLASYTGIKPSAGLLATCGTLDLSTLSKSYAVLLIIRRFIVQGGCPFCNRRMSEINEWRKSLLQLGIVPVILHSETAPDANLFFKEICNPQLRDIWRVSDPFYKDITQLCKAPDSGTTPMVFTTHDNLYFVKNFRKMAPAFAQGYFDPANRFKLEKNMKIEQTSLDVHARILLIKNDKVVKTWNHQKHEHAPDVLGDVITEMDWLTREFLVGKLSDLEDELSLDDSNDNLVEDSNNNEPMADEANLNQIEITLETNETPPNASNILNGNNHDIPSPSEFAIQSTEPPTNPEIINPPKEEIIEFEEPGSPASPASPVSPTQNLNSLLKDLQTNIDVYKKEKSTKFRFLRITPSEQFKELQEKTQKAKKKFQDLKAKHTSTSSSPVESTGCFPSVLPSTRFKSPQEVSLEDLGESMQSLAKLIESDRKRKYFKLFSAREYNAESILFWEDVTLFYQKLFKTSKMSMKRKAKIIEASARISTRYLFDDDSLFLLNTTQRLKDEVKQNSPKTIANLETNEDLEKAEKLFEAVLDDIMAHVLPDIFVRFVFSDEYKQMKALYGLCDK